MTKLNGTEKQIKWAEEIRKEAIESVNELTNEMISKYPEDKKEAAETMVKTIIDKLCSISDCNFWISNRNYSNYAEYLMGQTDRIEVAAGLKQTSENWYKIAFAMVKLGK